MATPLENFTAIGRLVFKFSEGTGEKLGLTVFSDLTYRIDAVERSLSWDFATAEDCLAWLESIDGDTSRIREQVKDRKIAALNARILEDQDELTRLQT